MPASIIWIGMDVHKDTVMAAVYADTTAEPEVVKQVPNEARSGAATKRAELYHSIAAKKSSRIAGVAVARELTGFLRAVMHDLETNQATPLSEAA